MTLRPTKLLLIGGLLLAAVGWVSLMGLLASTPATEQVDVGPYTDDGTLKAEITNLDRQGFHLTLSLKVTDKEGKTYGGLADNDIVVSDDGQRTGYTNFIPAGQAPLRVCLCIDYSKSMGGKKIIGAKKAALAMMGMLRDHRDQLGIYAFMGKADGMELLPIGPLTPARREQATKAINETPLELLTPMLANMDRALKAMDQVQGRRIMIVLTDGKDYPFGGPKEKQRMQKEVKPRIMQAAKDQGIPLYMIALEGGKKDSNDEKGMREFADASNGQFLLAPSPDKLEGIYRNIGASLQDEYTLEWDSPNPVEDGRTREVVVTVRSGSTGTEARTRYHVPGLVATGAAPKKANENDEEVQSPPFASIVLPLGGLLGLLFGIPYFRWRPTASAQ